MVKKLILEITDGVEETGISIDELLQRNMELHETITRYKDKITEYYRNKSWDRYKKISNEYEMIFTTPNTGTNISLYTPVSRSFFKMWEVLHDFRDEFGFNNDKPIKVCMLCEGPGGFAEALVKYRWSMSDVDEYHGISLKSNNNKNIPEWKINNEYLQKVKVCYGSDGTGNLYNMCNITHLVNTLGKESVDFITADGGFDFSSDFNHQEEMSLNLIFSEILTTLLLQKEGGSFILKIYDMFTENTLKIIHVLKKFYKNIYITKPLTSRPANSEKYIICTGFKRCDDFKRYFEIFYKLVLSKSEGVDRIDVDIDLSSIEYECDILRNIITYNAYYTMRQMYYIQRTIDYINIFRNNGQDMGAQYAKRLMNFTLEEHKRKSLKWCHKYNINV